MSDEWLQKAEAQRQQNERRTAPTEAERAATNKTFFEAHTARMVDILRQLGELWKSLDPHRTILGFIPVHIGNTYAVKVNHYKSRSVAIWLFDKHNFTRKYFGPHGAIGLLQPSIEIEAFDNHFMVSFQGGRQGASTLDEVKALIR